MGTRVRESADGSQPPQRDDSGGLRSDRHDTTPVTRTAHAQLVCIECRREWVDPRERWRIYLTNDKPTPHAVPYCEACARREFDP
jgi:hypothetical protein